MTRTAIGFGILTVLIGLMAVRTANRSNEGDLRFYYDHVTRVFQGHDPYPAEVTSSSEALAGFTYPPLFATLFLPLTALPFPVLRGVWFFVMAFIALRVYWVSFELVSRVQGPPGVPWLAVALGVACSIRFVWSDLGHGQVNLLIMGLTLEGIRCAVLGQDRRAGGLLALAVLLKLTPAIVVAGYVVSRRWRLVSSCAVVLVIGALAPSVTFGFEANLAHHYTFLAEVLSRTSLNFGAVGNNVAFSGWARRVFAGQLDPGQKLIPLLFTFDSATVQAVCRVISLLFLCSALWLGRRLPELRRGALLLAAIPLVSPMVWKPQLACLILPGVLCGRLLFTAGRHRPLIVAALVLLCLTGRFPLGRELANAAMVWGVVTLGVGLIPLAILVAPVGEGVIPSRGFCLD